MELRCIKCSHKVSRVYIQYSPGNIRLVKCGNCKSVADEYIECELMILIMDLILHKPQAYKHLLFNVLHHGTLDIGALLLRSSLIFLVLDSCKLWILNWKSEEWFSLGVGLKILLCALSGNLVFLSFFLALSSRFLKFVEGFNGLNNVLLAMIVSSYLKVYTLAMAVWEFPMSVLYIVDLFVMSSNLVALRVITESSFRRCVGVCLCAHALKFFVIWSFTELILY